jgi:protein SCO1/2
MSLRVGQASLRVGQASLRSGQASLRSGQASFRSGRRTAASWVAVNWIAFGAITLVSAGLRAEPQVVFPQGSDQPLAALQDIDVIEHLGEHIPSGLTFTNVAGQPVALDALLNRGKPVVVTLGYHRCPMLCGLVLDGLAKATHTSGLRLGQDFTAVDISIDPAEDSKLLTQSQHRVLDLVGGGATAAEWPFWLSTTDGATAARNLADAVGFRYKFDPRSKQFAHDAVAFVLTPEGVIARYLYGVDYPARDFRMAVVEAGGGRVGTSLDKAILACYRYDPAARRYAPFVMAFMRIGALLVFFALAGLLTVLWRKEIAMRKRVVPRPPGSGRSGPPPGPTQPNPISGSVA